MVVVDDNEFLLWSTFSLTQVNTYHPMATCSTRKWNSTFVFVCDDKSNTSDNL